MFKKFLQAIQGIQDEMQTKSEELRKEGLSKQEIELKLREWVEERKRSKASSYKPTLYVWKINTDPMMRLQEGARKKPCESCLYQASRGALPISEFPIPGNQPKHGKSNCKQYCSCTLEKVIESIEE